MDGMEEGVEDGIEEGMEEGMEEGIMDGIGNSIPQRISISDSLQPIIACKAYKRLSCRSSNATATSGS